MMTIRYQFVRLRTSKLFNSKFNFIQKAGITSRSTRGGPLSLPKPFPYEEKRYEWYHKFFDNSMLRLEQENAKIIVVEGPIAVGKTAFAQALARELDMKHMPEITQDAHYKLPSGYDLRQHDHEMPFLLKSFDHRNFCLNPTDVRTFLYQFKQLFYKFSQYVDTLAHLMNTGQGIVLERSYFSDFVFINAMYKNKFVSKEAFDVYNTVVKNSSNLLFPPHLIIYLDIPVPVVQERIRTRNYSYEQNSPALTTQYLQDLEYFWKNSYLKKALKHSEVLVYDWTDGGDVELICEDIENLNFDNTRSDGRFRCWQITRPYIDMRRRKYTNEKLDLLHYLMYPIFEVPECYVQPYITHQAYNKLSELPECQYDYGYNRAMGDSFWNILFKTNEEKYRVNKSHLYWYCMN